jgi:hypothetical protein
MRDFLEVSMSEIPFLDMTKKMRAKDPGVSWLVVVVEGVQS